MLLLFGLGDNNDQHASRPHQMPTATTICPSKSFWLTTKGWDLPKYISEMALIVFVCYETHINCKLESNGLALNNYCYIKSEKRKKK